MSDSSFVFGFAGRLVALALMIGVVAVSAPTLGWAQGTSVEELEQRLQKAKEDRARRDAAAARAREEAEAERKRKEADTGRAAAERKAQEQRQATLVVQTDAACTFMVNGREAAKLAVGINEVKVVPGQMLVSCVSNEEKVAYEGEIEGRSGQSAVLRIALKAKVAESRSAKACERGGRSSMRAISDSSTLQQCGTSLEWARTDSGRDMAWGEAQAYCRGLGGGWNLPTVQELRTLYSESLPGVPCMAKTCRVSEHFRLSSPWFWSSGNSGAIALDASEAWVVNLSTSDTNRFPITARGTRALCFRRP
jgi:hypothetical protein